MTWVDEHSGRFIVQGSPGRDRGRRSRPFKPRKRLSEVDQPLASTTTVRAKVVKASPRRVTADPPVVSADLTVTAGVSVARNPTLGTSRYGTASHVQPEARQPVEISVPAISVRQCGPPVTNSFRPTLNAAVGAPGTTPSTALCALGPPRRAGCRFSRQRLPIR